jgi:hypothetical protein
VNHARRDLCGGIQQWMSLPRQTAARYSSEKKTFYNRIRLKRVSRAAGYLGLEILWTTGSKVPTNQTEKFVACVHY